VNMDLVSTDVLDWCSVQPVQISVEIPDTSSPAVVEAIGHFDAPPIGEGLGACAVRDTGAVCCGIGSRVQTYLESVAMEIEGTDQLWYFEAHQWIDQPSLHVPLSSTHKKGARRRGTNHQSVLHAAVNAVTSVAIAGAQPAATELQHLTEYQAAQVIGTPTQPAAWACIQSLWSDRSV
jgi:hypothetical protein